MGDIKMTNQELIKEFANFKNYIKNSLQNNFEKGFELAFIKIIAIIKDEFPAPAFRALEDRIIQEFSVYENNQTREDHDQE